MFRKFLGYLFIPIYYLILAATSSFLFFQWMLTLLREKSSNFRNPPFFKQRSIFATNEEKINSAGRKNIKFNGKVDYRKLNEGFGGAYERIAYSWILRQLANKYKVKKILELNSTYIAGVPAFNSSILVQEGFDVTITVHSRDYTDALLAWKIAGLSKKVKIVKWDNDFKTPFGKGEFDLVWNHLAVEHYKDPMPLLTEMGRVSKKLVVTMTLSPFNLGFIAHFIWHKSVGKYWDHGIIKNTLISTMERMHKKSGLKVIESGGCDDPPSPDTVDSKMGESMTYLDALPKSVSENWVWSAIDPKCKESRIVKFFWFMERSYPEWFRRLTAHHLYTASLKNNI